MDILDKKDMKNKLSQFSFFNNKQSHHLNSKVKYLAGIPVLEDLKNKGKFDPSISKSIFRMRPLGLEIRIISGLTSRYLGLYEDQINFWSFEHHDDISEDKSKSIVGNALVGGMLFGVGGAVLGGLSESIDKADHILSISYKDDEQDKLFLFSSTSHKASKAYDFMQTNFGDKYKDPASLKKEKTEKASSQNSRFSVADELQKLNELKETGILSKEEFEQQKQKLLNR